MVSVPDLSAVAGSAACWDRCQGPTSRAICTAAPQPWVLRTMSVDATCHGFYRSPGAKSRTGCWTAIVRSSRCCVWPWTGKDGAALLDLGATTSRAIVRCWQPMLARSSDGSEKADHGFSADRGGCRAPSSWQARSARPRSWALPSDSRVAGPTSRGTPPARGCSGCADGA